MTFFFFLFFGGELYYYWYSEAIFAVVFLPFCLFLFLNLVFFARRGG